MSKTSIGQEENITAFLCYVLGWISGLIILLMEKENSNVRFHAMQSIVTFGGLTVLSILFGGLIMTGIMLMPLINLAAIALWIFLMVKAYQGEHFRLPVVGAIAEDWSKKFKL